MFCIFRRLRNLEKRTNHMAGELEALKAAMAADAENDARLVAFLADLKAKLDDVNAKLAEAMAREVIDPAEVQAAADALNAHVVEMAQHILADPAA